METAGLNSKEAARELRISTATLRRLVKQGKLFAVCPAGRKLIFSRTIIQRYLNGEEQRPQAN
jgi:excisionase family DNA binding protein